MSAKLLNIDANAKTVKGQKYGYLTGILYLAPASLSGKNVCSMAVIADCIKACLNTAGRGAFTTTQAARIRKTNWFFDNRQTFMMQLVKDIGILTRRAARKGLIPVVRLNGTSDIKWENIRFDYEGNQVTIFELFPDVQFYDYTKTPNRNNLPANYHVTFSYSGVSGFQKYAKRAMEIGLNLAVVFDVMPDTFLGLPVVNGDSSDLRFLDPKNVIVGLTAKGKAKKDNSGFVIMLKQV